jgi:hypothetical protein
MTHSVRPFGNPHAAKSLKYISQIIYNVKGKVFSLIIHLSCKLSIIVPSPHCLYNYTIRHVLTTTYFGPLFLVIVRFLIYLCLWSASSPYIGHCLQNGSVYFQFSCIYVMPLLYKMNQYMAYSVTIQTLW